MLFDHVDKILEPPSANHSDLDMKFMLNTLGVTLIAITARDVCFAQTQERVEPVGEIRNWLESEAREPFANQTFANQPLNLRQSQAVRTLLWNDQIQTLKKDRLAEWQDKRIVSGDTSMKFELKRFGNLKSYRGRSLFISMHGGGGTAPRVNEQQWRNQIRLYQPAEGVYLAPRAPTDTWNMWHQSHIDQCFERIIQDAIMFENVDPNRIYLMGYSAGGDGVYQLAPRMADYFAAAAMMAGHPNNASPLGLRNLGFTIHMGGRDSAYERNKIALRWKERLLQLQQDDRTGYPHKVVIYPQHGHWMKREDASAIPWMGTFTRNPRPDKILWHQGEVVHDNFYWLRVDKDQAQPGSTVIVRRKGQRFVIEKADNVADLVIQLNDQIVDLDEPVVIEFDGKTLFNQKVKRTAGTILDSIQRRFDPDLVYCAEVRVSLEGE